MKKYLKIAWLMIIHPVFGISFLKNIFALRFFSKNKILISLTEHLGDIVAAEPVSRFLKQNFPGKKIIWLVNNRYKSLFQYYSAVDGYLTVRCFTEWIWLKKIIRKNNIYDLHISGKQCERFGYTLKNPNADDINIENYFDKGNLLHDFSRSAGITLNSSTAPELVVDKARPTKNSIVLHANANIGEKSLDDAARMQVTAWIRMHYPDAQITEIGDSSPARSATGERYHYTGKISLPQMIDLINKCRLFIGIESGPAHLANALQKESLIWIGKLANFSHYMPYSGFFQEYAPQQTWYFTKPLHQVSFDELLPSLKNLLVQKQNTV